MATRPRGNRPLLTTWQTDPSPELVERHLLKSICFAPSRYHAGFIDTRHSHTCVPTHLSPWLYTLYTALARRNSGYIRSHACGVVSPKLKTDISRACLSVPAETCKRPHTGYLTGDQFGLLPCVFNWPHVSLYYARPCMMRDLKNAF